MGRTSKQVQTKRKQQQQQQQQQQIKNTTEQVFCQDALTQTLCRQGTFSLFLNTSVVRK